MNRQTLNRFILLLTFVTISSCSSVATYDVELTVHPDEVIGQTGRYLTGIHFVYNYERDEYYEDDSIATWARDAGVTVARFPGGSVVKYWDWRNPTGYQKTDHWDDPKTARVPGSEWMSLDEYLHFVDVAGITPLIGVNMLSGVRNDRVEDSVSRASDQVKYVVSRGHEGAFYYLGNEDIGLLGGIEEAARTFVLHARAIKEIDPEARLLWNDNHVDRDRFRRFLEIAGEHADGLEFHGKWPYGDRRIDDKMTVEGWQQHFPFSERKRGQFSARARDLRAYARDLGRPDLIFANNEYGLAQFREERFVGFDRYLYGLVSIEFLQDLFIGQFDMAAFWSNVAATRSAGGDRHSRRLLDTEAEGTVRLNPFHFGLELLASAQGKNIVQLDGGGPSGYGFAVRMDESLQIFLLNKSSESSTVHIVHHGEIDPNPGGTMLSLVGTPDKWGRLADSEISLSEDAVKLVLPALSYSKISVTVRSGSPRMIDE